ncbi:hypothetical protein O3M35_012445 [Rhynocoris fuscipes]|uniref:CHCH domain-containing protein n=1 Tax=Rhynocoris fuscipes TaxID=488301 RepID=A0AAW1CZQ0_9HEMI
MSSQEEVNSHGYVLVKKEELASPSTIKLPERDKPHGLILDDGSINWSCPCLGGMVAGPCGVPFREAFSCFHYSQAEPKGSDCMDAFSKMQECMQQYPKLYGPKENGNDDDDLFNVEQNDMGEREKIDINRSKIEDGDLKEAVNDVNTNKEMARSDNKLNKKNQ